MKKQQNIYKTLTKIAQQLLGSRQLPIYSSRFSRKDFTTYQLTVLLIIKTFERKGYRAFVQWLEASHIPQWLKLRKIPHFTTLQKFASRQLIQRLEDLLKSSGMMGDTLEHVGIDASGMTLYNASRHYEKRVDRSIKKRDFLKFAIVCDLDDQLILAAKLRKSCRHDTKDFLPLWNKVKKLPFRWWYADKGYDAESIFAEIEKCGKKSFGCIRVKTGQWHRMKGKARRRALKCQWQCKKNWRALVETINSVIKRLFGSVIHAKNLHTMKVEMFLRLLIYNLYRIGTRNLRNLAFALACLVVDIWNMTRFITTGWSQPVSFSK